MKQSFRFQITNEEEGQRVDLFLASRFGSLSRMRIANLLEESSCLLNGGPARAGRHLSAGDLLEVTLGATPQGSMTPEPIPVEILYEDDHLAVVMKPAGMLVHPTLSVKGGTLANALAHHFNQHQIQDLKFEIGAQVVRPGLVHRLDKPTSGLMVVAKTQRALSVLSRHFHKRLVEKRYLALVSGHMPGDGGAIVAPIGRQEERQPRWWVSEGGKEAETRYAVRQRFSESELVELEPVTGRTNQLRIHCAYAGYPILGDALYGGQQEPPQITRLCLHAWRLAFHHPSGGGWMEFTSPLPPDWPASGDGPYLPTGLSPTSRPRIS